jgi:hypothetical protein
MRSVALAGLLLAASCQPAAAPQPPAPPDAGATAPRSDSCREDIPDCSAICALRETGRTAYLEFFERRCAAVLQGKNPNKITTDLEPTPYVDAGAVEPAPTSAPTGHAALPTSVPEAPFDPTSVGRTGSGEPPECKASRLLRAQKRDREADVLAALCAAKGGDAGL